MVAGGGAGEQIVAQAQIAQVLGDDAIVAVRQLLGAQALLFRFHENRGAVFVRARHHQHVVAFHALVACVHVRRHAEAGHVADVTGAVRVRPCDIHQNMTHKARLSGAAGTPVDNYGITSRASTKLGRKRK